MHTLNAHEPDHYPHNTILIIHTVEGAVVVRKDQNKEWGNNSWNLKGAQVAWSWLKTKYKNWQYTVLYEDDDTEEEVS